jgi:tetratricopeptide (TPR) repeat protein
MNTSSEAIRQLQDALANAQQAGAVIDDLIAPHDYQDVASVVVKAAAALLETTTLLMQSKSEEALEALERADDLLDTVYAIIDSEVDEDE